MNNKQDEWFQSILDELNDEECEEMESENYLDAVKQLESTRSDLLRLIPEQNKNEAEEYINRMEEIAMLMYNLQMKRAVCFVKDKETES